MDNTKTVKKFQPHLLLPENKVGRDFIVADIHGHRQLLERHLEQLGFSASHDRLISVGDLIDRGPDSAGCLDLLEEPWFWTVRGNHEQLLIDAVVGQTDALWSRWLLNGGSWVLSHEDVQVQDWANALQYLPLTITVPVAGAMIGICHAEYNEAHWADRYDASETALMAWIWGRKRLKTRDATPVAGIDWVFSGHTLVKKVETLGNSVFIDQGAFLNNPMTLIDLKDWLANHDALTV